MSSYEIERATSLRELMTRSENRSYSWVKRLRPIYETILRELPALHTEDIRSLSLRAFVEPLTSANHAFLEHLVTCGLGGRAGETLDAVEAVARPTVDGKYPLGQDLTIGVLWLLKDKELKRLSLRDPEIRIVRRLFPKPKR